MGNRIHFGMTLIIFSHGCLNGGINHTGDNNYWNRHSSPGKQWNVSTLWGHLSSGLATGGS